MTRFSQFLAVLVLTASSTFAADKPLKIWVNSQTDKLYYENMVIDYQRRVDKDFKAEVQSFGFMQMPDKLAVAIKTGVNPPDVVQLDEMFLGMYLRGEVPFLDITERFKESKLHTNIQQERLDLFTWQKKLYGIPQSLSACVIYYRSDLFKENNIKESDIDTWQKLSKVGAKLKEDTGMSLLALDWSYFEMILRQRGVSLFTEDGKSNLEDSKVLETLEFIDGIAANGAGLSPDRGSIFDPAFFGGDIMNQEVLAIANAGWYGLDMIQAYSPDDLVGKWRAMPLPAWDGDKKDSKRRTSTFSGQGLLVFKKSPQPDLAWKFLEWVMLDKEAAVQRFLQNNSFSAFQPSWTDERFLKPSEFYGGQSLGKLMVELSKDIPGPNQHPGRLPVVGMLRERHWGELMFDERSAEDVIGDLVKMLNSPPPQGGPQE